MVSFRSLVVVDLETTSLPQFEQNQTKITEIAFVGCQIQHLHKSKALPRVLHKLVLLLNPLRLISSRASSLSGITNEMLEDLNCFSEEDATVLKLFIKRLPSPVCIVAHNGDKFDFPILRKELDKLKNKFPDDFYCADSLQAFRSLYRKQSPKPRETLQAENETTPPKNQKARPLNTLNYKVSRELFPEHEHMSKWASIQEEAWGSVPASPSTNLEGFSLKALYKFLHNRELSNAHRAEDDALALLSCIIRSDGFVNWLSYNAVPLNNIPPL